jgi:hypothetical protein
MPLGRYFLYVGGVLLTLLFVADWYFSPLKAASTDTTSTNSDFDHAIIRIHSIQKWPQAVVIDTTLPTIVPPPSMIARARAPAAPGAKPVREALAMAIEPAPAKSKESTKTAKPHVRHVRVARAAPRFTPFGMFGYNNAWPAGW